MCLNVLSFCVIATQGPCLLNALHFIILTQRLNAIQYARPVPGTRTEMNAIQRLNTIQHPNAVGGGKMNAIQRIWPKSGNELGSASLNTPRAMNTIQPLNHHNERPSVNVMSIIVYTNALSAHYDTH